MPCPRRQQPRIRRWRRPIAESSAKGYTAAAVAILRQLHKGGYFNDPAHVKQFQDDPRLTPLRGREEVRKLMEK